jgi:hypothetical protein
MGVMLGQPKELFDERAALRLVDEKKILKHYFGFLNDLVEVVLWVKRRLVIVIHHLLHPKEVKKVV